MTKNEVDIGAVVQNDYEVPVSPHDGRYTKTSMFMLNAIDLNMYQVSIKPFFVNAFLDDKEYRHDFVRPIFVLFKVRFARDQAWQTLYDSLKKKENFLTDYDCGLQDDCSLIMCVFKCDDRYKDDYYAFKRGTYSKFSTPYRNKFFKTIPGPTGAHVNSIAHGAIFKEEWLKKELMKTYGLTRDTVSEMNELWDLPNKDREYYRYKNANTEKERSSSTEESVTHG